MSRGCVCVPVANLRKEPEQQALNYQTSDPKQESQLLYGEVVELLERQGDWWRVSATEQSRWSDEAWNGYPGWVQANQVTTRAEWWKPNLLVIAPWTDVSLLNGAKVSLSLGTRLEGIALAGERYLVQLVNGSKGYIKRSDVISHTTFNPEAMLDLGHKLLGHPYLWGGRSIHRPDWSEPLTGLDCSGLTQLLYLTQGVELPRDAHDQFLKSERINRKQLQFGDLVFTPGRENPNRMGHVMLYVGNGQVLESARSLNGIHFSIMETRIGEGVQYGRVAGV